MYARDSALIATPVGIVRIDGEGDAITSIRIGADGVPRAGATEAVHAAAEQLAGYFAGTRASFDLPLAPARTLRGGALRQAIVDIGYGDRRTYGEVADTIGSSARAMGQACSRNALPIVVPCHRVIGGTGGGHYSAGDGLSTKNWLLDHEQRYREQLSG